MKGKAKQYLRDFSQFARSKTAAVGAGVGSLVAMGSASAAGGGTDLGAAITEKITGMEGSLQGIFLVLIGVVALFLLYSYFKRVK